jgi:hypothetical protein
VTRLSWATRKLPESAVLVAGLALGVVLRAVQIATSIGTVDASNWLRHVLYVDQLGVLRVYQTSWLVNHPTLGLEIAYWTWKIGGKFGMHFFDTFRILTSVADVATALALYALGRRIGGETGVWLALTFFLSPAAIFISAFHCNTDPIMVMFVVLALLATVTRRPILAGVLVALAIGTKIIAFAALPLMFFAFRGWKDRSRFLGAAAAIGAVIFVPPVVVSGWVVIRNIFGYTGWGGAWGIPLVARLAEVAVPVTPILLAALIALWSAEAWKGAGNVERLPRSTGLAFLLVLFLAPGFGVQYFHWILPYPALLLRRWAAVLLHALVSVFLFLIYTSWSGGWPWLWANRGTNPSWMGMFGLVVWAGIGAAAFVGARGLDAKRAA